MESILTALYGCIAGVTAARAQGTVLMQNNLGASITYVLTPEGGPAMGANYSVETFTYDPVSLGVFGIQLGPTVTFGPNGRFSAASIPELLPDTH